MAATWALYNRYSKVVQCRVIFYFIMYSRSTTRIPHPQSSTRVLEAMHYTRLLITQKTGIKNLKNISTDWPAEVSFFPKRTSSRLTVLYFAKESGGDVCKETICGPTHSLFYSGSLEASKIWHLVCMGKKHCFEYWGQKIKYKQCLSFHG